MRVRRTRGWWAVALLLVLGTGAKGHKLVDRWVDPGAISVRAVPLVGSSEAARGEAWSAEVRGDGTLRQMIEQTLPVSKKESRKYGVEATLWDADGRDRARGGRTDPHTQEQMRKGAAEFVQFVMYALEIDDLIKGSDPYPH